MNMKTAIYCRTATPDPFAIEMQREALLRYVAAHGFGAVEIYEDDGFSGSDPARPAFARMNADIAAGRVARVLARNVARLGRNISDVLAWARAALEQGVEVITMDMDAVFTPERFAALEAAMENTICLRRVGENEGYYRTYYQNEATGELYALTDFRGVRTWNTATPAGEPDMPLKDGLRIELVEDGRVIRREIISRLNDCTSIGLPVAEEEDTLS